MPKRPGYKLFPDSESLEWDLLEAEEVRRSDTFDTWIERIGYADLHPKLDDAVYNIAAPHLPAEEEDSAQQVTTAAGVHCIPAAPAGEPEHDER
ncbi:MAG: hypothetical protein HC793_01790 [Aquincola sp.]|nr:hypothetical protein [Aquincola sp.]